MRLSEPGKTHISQILANDRTNKNNSPKKTALAKMMAVTKWIAQNFFTSLYANLVWWLWLHCIVDESKEIMGSRNYFSLFILAPKVTSTYFSLLSSTTRVNTVNTVELIRVDYTILRWLVNGEFLWLIICSSKHSAQLYDACARIACFAPSCY